MIDWREIHAVFLDMDGTLLDLHFDNHFWLEHVPMRYAQARGIALPDAKETLKGRYKDAEGTMQWYCLDHWSRELGLDIALLKEEVDHLIVVHPHVIDFLHRMRDSGKRTVLVTNAHQKALRLKLDRTQLAGFFDAVICAHDLGRPKEDPGFWDHLQKVEPFDRQHTLFVDDSVAVLRSARNYGFRWLLSVARPDATSPPRTVPDFPAIHDFSEIMP